MYDRKPILDSAFWRELEKSRVPTAQGAATGPRVGVFGLGQQHEFSHVEALSEKPKVPDLRGTSGDVQPIDLYWWWSDLTGFRVAIPSLGEFPTRFSFIAEGDFDDFKDWCKVNTDVDVLIRDGYAAPISEGGTKSSFFTFDVVMPQKKVERVFNDDPTTGSVANISGSNVDSTKLQIFYEKLLRYAKLTRVQFGYPIGNTSEDSTPNVPSDPKFGPTECRPKAAVPPETEVVKECKPEASFQTQTKVVIGVIDDGAAFAHASVRDHTRPFGTRVVAVWNQSQRIKLLQRKFWQHPAPDWSASDHKYWYGSMMSGVHFETAMKANVSPLDGQVDELKCYASLLRPTEFSRTLHLRESHGAAVMTAAAGAINPKNVISANPDATQQLPSRDLNDAASQAPIIFVDLPYELKKFSSGRWMPMAALDGVRFILSQARARFTDCHKADVPVVINISSGSNAGCHDGSSIFESALAELLRYDERLAITLAAGNSRLAHAHSDVVVQAGGDGSIAVRVPPDKPTETYVEIWPEWADGSSTFLLAELNSLTFSIESPDKRVFQGVQAGADGVEFKDRENRTVAGFKFAKHAVQSKNRPMALLVIAATTAHEWRPRPACGNWVLRCHNGTSKVLRLQSWIERDEVVFGIRQPQLAHFVHDGEGSQNVRQWDDEIGFSVSRYNTTSNFANAAGAFAVAAGVGGRASGYVSPYSGGGAKGQGMTRPMLMARADRSPAQPGMPAFGNAGGARFHMNGTSIAAPHAARWIANNFAEGRYRPHIQCLTMYSEPRIHPRLNAVAAGEGRIFIEDADSAPAQCVGT